MTFLSPGWLLLGALTIVVLLLHMRRRRQLDVPSTVLWKLLQNSAAPQRSIKLPPITPLLIAQVLVVLLVALGLSQPIFGTVNKDGAHTVYVLDASASMRATDLSPSRFDAAVSRLERLVEAGASTPNARVSVILAGPEARIEVARQTGSAAAFGLTARVRASDGAADWAGAARLINSLLRSDEASIVVLLTDGADTGAATLAEGVPGVAIARTLFAGTDTTNVGLTATLAPVNVEQGDWTLAGTVRFSGPTPASIAVETLFQPAGTDGFLTWNTTTVTRAGEANEATFSATLKLPAAGALLVRLPQDAGPHDNAVTFGVRRAAVPMRVLYLGAPTGPLLAALQSIDNVALIAADQLPADDATYDLVVVDGVSVVRRPGTNVLWIGGAFIAGQPRPLPVQEPYVTGWLTEHPLSDQVDWTVVSPTAAFRVARLAGGAVLAESNGAPLVQARTTRNGREVQLAFTVADAGWIDRPGFPVFVNNLVRWLGTRPGAAADPVCVVGAPCPVEARLLSSRIVAPDGTEQTLVRPDGGDIVLPGIERSFAPDRAGLYRIETGRESRLIAVHPAAAGELVLASQDSAVSSDPPALPRQLWWWVLALALIALVVETVAAGLGPEQFLRPEALSNARALANRRRILLGVRLVAIVGLVSALAGLPIPGREAAEDIVVVLGTDLGPTTRNPDREKVLDAVEARFADAGAAAHAGVVVAAMPAQIIRDLAARPAPWRDDPFRKVTVGADLEAAVQMAAAMLPSNRTGRVVLATDGNEATGELAGAIKALRARNVAVDIKPMSELPPGEVLVEIVHAPTRVYQGDTFLLDAVLYAQAPVHASFSIRRQGVVVMENEIDLLAGRNRVETLVAGGGEPGKLLLEVSVTAPRDTFAENNKNGAIVEVTASPAIAIITPDAAVGDYFARALSVQGLTAKVLAPRNVPKKMDDWLVYDSVVMMNVPAISLDTEQQEQLERLVQIHGRGLLLLGGETSFGPGGYFATPFERMSPLSSKVPHEAPKVALVFVLDRSGSMTAAADDTGKITRLDVAKEATLTSVGLLNDDARIGIVVFDGDGYVLLPIQQQKNEAEIEKSLLPLIPGGGTYIFSGLSLAMDMIERIDASAKHIIVMTDGLSQEANFAPLFARAAAAHVTISAIAISSAADPRQPLAIAEGGKGAFYHTDDMRALPSILSQETLMLSSSPIKRIIAPVTWVDASPDFLAGLPARMPPVHGYIRTTLQPQADAHLMVTDEKGEAEPLMASWRYGNGHVLALATHGAGTGTAEWLDMPEYPLMWSQVIRHFLPDAGGPGVHVTLQRGADGLVVTADVLDKAGNSKRATNVTATGPEGESITLREVSLGRYEGAFRLPAPGAWSVEVMADDATGAATTYLGYPARYEFGRTDFDKLRALTAATGGRVMAVDDPIFSDATEWVAHPGWRLWAVLGLLLFLLDLTVRYAPTIFGARKGRATAGQAVA